MILRKFKDKEQNEEFSILEPSAEAIQHTHISIPTSVPLHPHAVTYTSSPSMIQTTVYTPSVTQATIVIMHSPSVITTIPTVITSTNTATVSTASTVIAAVPFIPIILYIHAHMANIYAQFAVAC